MHDAPVYKARVFDSSGNCITSTYIKAYQFEINRNGFKPTENGDFTIHKYEKTVILTPTRPGLTLDSLMYAENMKDSQHA